MIKKSTLERIISEDLAAIWTILNAEEKHLIADYFVIHNFKKNQIIYAEKDEPQFLWCLLKGKVKLFKDGIGGASRFYDFTAPSSTSATARSLPKSLMCRRPPRSSRPPSARCPCNW